MGHCPLGRFTPAPRAPYLDAALRLERQSALMRDRHRRKAMLAGKRIYIVDDDSGFLKGIERLLRTHGLKARTFVSAEAFEAEADLTDAACLIVDIHLGDISGIELVRRMFGRPASIPFIVVTGNGSERTREAAAAAGCCAYLEKPFSSKVLLASIWSALNVH